MGKSKDLTTRQAIITQRLSGMPYKQIAQLHKVSYSTIYSIWKRYKRQGWDGLIPSYNNCGLNGPQFGTSIYEFVITARQNHSDWGAPYIRAKLEQQFPHMSLPSIRTIQGWFKKEGLTPLKVTIPSKVKEWASKVHQVWQIDAKERLHFPSGEVGIYLTITDECSGGLLDARVFPL